MVVNSVLCWIFLLLQISVSLGEGQNKTSFVISGPEAEIQDFPYALSLRRNGIHIGGGAIISPVWAITAAHILLGCPPSQLSIRAGSSERMIGGSLHNTNNIVLHHLFDPHNLEYNVALVGMLDPFEFSDTIAAVPLDFQGTIVDAGTLGHFSGFGVVMPGTNNLSPVLRYTTLTVESTSSCEHSLTGYLRVTANMLCTISSTQNPCHGDFGGPLVGANSRVLIGIASWNPFCSDSGYSTAFTRIAAPLIRSFIRQIVGF